MVVIYKNPSSIVLYSPNPSIVLREISPRLGRGWFAQENIPAGILLWKEQSCASAANVKDLVQIVEKNPSKYEHLCWTESSQQVELDENVHEKHRIARGKVQSNHFVYPDGVLLFEKISLLNHSCHPNACLTIHQESSSLDDESCKRTIFSGSDRESNSTARLGAVVETARDIAAGDEISISYSDHALFQSLSFRRDYLRSKWGFDCACERCRFQFAAERPKDAASIQLLEDVWPLLEQAAAISDKSKPRQRNVDPACLDFQRQASEAVAQYLPHLKQGKRFQTDLEYFT